MWQYHLSEGSDYLIDRQRARTRDLRVQNDTANTRIDLKLPELVSYLLCITSDGEFAHQRVRNDHGVRSRRRGMIDDLILCLQRNDCVPFLPVEPLRIGLHQRSGHARADPIQRRVPINVLAEWNPARNLNCSGWPASLYGALVDPGDRALHQIGRRALQQDHTIGMSAGTAGHARAARGIMDRHLGLLVKPTDTTLPPTVERNRLAVQQ